MSILLDRSHLISLCLYTSPYLIPQKGRTAEPASYDAIVGFLVQPSSVSILVRSINRQARPEWTLASPDSGSYINKVWIPPPRKQSISLTSIEEGNWWPVRAGCLIRDDADIMINWSSSYYLVLVFSCLFSFLIWSLLFWSGDLVVWWSGGLVGWVELRLLSGQTFGILACIGAELFSPPWTVHTLNLFSICINFSCLFIPLSSAFVPPLLPSFLLLPISSSRIPTSATIHHHPANYQTIKSTIKSDSNNPNQGLQHHEAPSSTLKRLFVPPITPHHPSQMVSLSNQRQRQP